MSIKRSKDTKKGKENSIKSAMEGIYLNREYLSSDILRGSNGVMFSTDISAIMEHIDYLISNVKCIISNSVNNKDQYDIKIIQIALQNAFNL